MDWVGLDFEKWTHGHLWNRVARALFALCMFHDLVVQLAPMITMGVCVIFFLFSPENIMLFVTAPAAENRYNVGKYL